jgi:phosphoglycolate phosphatase-like HAD superfamily hydrolase
LRSSIIVLWDIDNTLLYTGGAGSIAMNRAFVDLYGLQDGFARVEFSGRSDRAILGDALRAHGIADSPEEVARFVDAYLPHIDRALSETQGMLMPGITEVLAALDGHVHVTQGLGTGNFRRAAEAKLAHYGIAQHFPGVVGGFGDDHADRQELIRIGIDRLRNGAASEARIVVIGDTPHDVSAAKANRAFSVGVATGRDSVETLAACGANAVFADLSDTEHVVATVVGEAYEQANSYHP